VIATYLDHTQWPSPISIPDLTDWKSTYGENIAGIALDNGDGTYAAQLTIYKAGRFRLNIRVNTLDIKNSPFKTIEVSPTNVYGPTSIQKGIPAAMVAGTDYTFQVQGRDFYSNNI